MEKNCHNNTNVCMKKRCKITERVYFDNVCMKKKKKSQNVANVCTRKKCVKNKCFDEHYFNCPSYYMYFKYSRYLKLLH